MTSRRRTNRKGRAPARPPGDRRSGARRGGAAGGGPSAGRWALRLILVAVVAAAGYLAWLDLQVRAQFEGKRWAVPARLYARPLDLYPGMPLSADELVRELEAIGYRAAPQPGRPGTYSRQSSGRGERVAIATRRFVFWDGVEPARRLRTRFRDGRLVALEAQGRAVAPVRLEPAEIGAIYPAHHEDRVLVRLEEVPPTLVETLIAVEDRGFHRHHGISLRGIGRALLANLRAGATVQGGSTLTQQLAKNFYLTPERTLWRKLNEAAIALLLELHYDKAEILEAYLNEVFLGQDGRRAIHGFGLAARYYFGRPLEELALSEQALLVGLVRGPSYYDPRRHPERARARRNRVLDVLAEQRVLSEAQVRSAASRPLGVTAEPPRGNAPHPAFVDLVKRQLHRDYREEDLRSEGLRIFTTLSPRVQGVAERALGAGIERLRRAGRSEAGLQGAVVVTDVQSGEVLALVGGRDPRSMGFNRALHAMRPIGSLIKPAVYLTALERSDRYTLSSLLDDAPIRVRGPDGRIWTPRNYDGEHHGQVALYAALAHSYNVATVRLGMALGLEDVVATLRRLGIERNTEAYPSLLLGALDLSPLEVAQMYQTLASGGFRVPLRAIREVTDARGAPLTRYDLSIEQTFEPEPVYLLTRALQEVVRTGTARSLGSRLDPGLGLAGKTGTTDELRDSWFAGFGGERLAVVWLGRDDNRPAGLTGASGALPVFAALMDALGPKPLEPRPPAGVEWYRVDVPRSRRTDRGCPGTVALPYLRGSAPPYAPCPALAGGSEPPDPAPGPARRASTLLRR